ncbi:MAG: NRDE family protein [Planctomycetota bacterium]|nr:MAG: NRDE family protein [Planctomycetota bacterium]
MCLIAVGWKAHPEYPLVLAANRDEFHDRPTAPAAFWDDAPDLLAGRDLRAGGTWLGVSRKGRVAAVTNVREAAAPLPGARSRGTLVRDALLASAPAAEAAAAAHAAGEGCAPFNLFLTDGKEFWAVTNRGASPRALEPGVHVFSNGPLDAPWPKAERLRAGLRSRLERTPAVEELLELLCDRSLPAGEAPQSELERVLAPVFVVSSEYGTRSSTVLLVDAEGRVVFVECSFDPEGRPCGSRGVAFSFDRWA